MAENENVLFHRIQGVKLNIFPMSEKKIACICRI
jgi:hypothetical protein